MALDVDQSAHQRRHKLYYDDVTWKGLGQLKQQVDAGDLFHTRFTVQLPQASPEIELAGELCHNVLPKDARVKGRLRQRRVASSRLGRADEVIE